MLRSFLIYLSKAAWARRIVTQWKFARRAASRFVAGENLEDAVRVVNILNAKKINVTLDLLGEHTTNIEEAKKATQDILEIFEVIDKSGVRANVSVKLTQIGLALGEEICEEKLRLILSEVKKRDTFLRLDMEDSKCVDNTLALYQRAREVCGCENIGVVIQSYLYRSQEDVARLLESQTRVRLCKGAYKEPAEIAFPRKADVDANYDQLVKMLFDGALKAGSPRISGNGRVPPIPAIATHDEKRIEFAKRYAEQIGLPKDAFEFQMLYGIRQDLQEKLSKEGYLVRTYVAYGTEWYPFYTRRLAERPANLWFFVSNFFKH
jgi:proline dehydrogenase